MTTPVASVWTVDDAAQAAFAQLSGDVNPIHVDALAARRLPFGRVVVHGIHLAVDALDRWCAAHADLTPTRLAATFRSPVGPGDALTVRWDDGGENESENEQDDGGDRRPFAITVDVGPAHAVEMSLHAVRSTARHLPPTPSPDTGPSAPPAARRERPIICSLDDLPDRSGLVAADASAGALAARFPALTAALGPAGVAELVALSPLVGMHAPGLHSMFSSLTVELGPIGEPVAAARLEAAASPAVAYRVARVDPRFARATIDVRGSALHGSVTAFVRPAPVDQQVSTDAVTPDEFATQRWLVVGGSRGLGAAAVQLLTAGGADVRFTYHRGHDDAERLTGLTGATATPLDVEDDLLAGVRRAVHDGWAPTHLVWCASPPIFVAARDAYSPELFERFVRVYVDAFESTIDTLLPGGLQGALWPSSEAADSPVPGLAEYGDAKRLGEQRCRDLSQRRPGLHIATPRFPRLLTDQSTSFVPTEFGDTAAEVLAGLRAAARRP